MEKMDKSKIEDALNRGVAELIDKGHLEHRLLAGDKLRVKFGIDPTSPNIHLGRAVTLLKLRDLQDLGHEIVFIIGDFTGVIGDTSDKESERPMLTEETVQKNLATYKEQAGKLLDMGKVEFHYNSEWLSKLGYKEIAEQTNLFSVSEFIARENIRKRLDKGTRVSLREMLYPIMQGYDSVMVRADLEIGGTDQRFNILAGREMQKHYGQEPQDAMFLNLIEGTDGRKMSSSWGNVINIMETSNEMFGKVMSIKDDLIIPYYIHCTRVPMEAIRKMEKDIQNGKNPRDIKLCLAHDIVKIYHGEKEALAAQRYFIDVFSKKEVPDEVLEFKPVSGQNVIEFMVAAGLAESKGDARRKIEQGGVSINGEKLRDGTVTLNPESHDGKIMRVGKLNFVRIKF